MLKVDVYTLSSALLWGKGVISKKIVFAISYALDCN